MSETGLIASVSNRKEERLHSYAADQVSASTFNGVMLLTLVWGFFVNAAMVAFFAKPIISVMAGLNPWVMIIGYIGLTILGTLIAVKSDNPVISFLGYNIIVLTMGALLCITVPFFSAAVVTKALLLTGIVTATMVLLGFMRPQLFLSMGRTLFIAMLVGIVAELVATFLLHYTGAAFDWLFVLIFSGYIGFDVAKAQVYPKTVDNAIDCALDLYVDIIVLFVRLLSILSRDN